MTSFNLKDYEDVVPDGQTSESDRQNQEDSVTSEQESDQSPTDDQQSDQPVGGAKITLSGNLSDTLAQALVAVFPNSSIEKTEQDGDIQDVVSIEGHQLKKPIHIYTVEKKEMSDSPNQVVSKVISLNKRLSEESYFLVYIEARNKPFTLSNEEWVLTNVKPCSTDMVFSTTAAVDVVRSRLSS